MKPTEQYLYDSDFEGMNREQCHAHIDKLFDNAEAEGLNNVVVISNGCTYGDEIFLLCGEENVGLFI